MPSLVLSHQAPALFLKIKYPNKFDGTALCLSTIIPDLDLLIMPFFPLAHRAITHSLLGVLLWTVPLTILITIIFSKYLGSFFATIAKGNSVLSYFGVDDWDYFQRKRYDRKFYIVATYSAIIGGLTHLLLDLPSHAYIELFFPWIIFQNPNFLLYSIIDFGAIDVGLSQIEYDFTVYQLIWSIETMVTIVMTLYLLRYIKKHNLIPKWYNAQSKLST